MPLRHLPLAGEPRLRVNFNDASIAVGLPVGSTIGELADWVDGIARLHKSSLLSIDIRMAARNAAPAVERNH
jgi:hypothetical protein